MTPLVIILTAAFIVPLLCMILRITGTLLLATVFTQTAALYLGAAWLSVVRAE